MRNHTKLVIVKIIHTAIWVFFNLVIFYMLYAVLSNKLDLLLWICYALCIMEGITLLIFRLFCPLTILARRYTDAKADNFDIYLPNWLAKNTKLIYSGILFVILLITIWRLMLNT